MKTKLFLLFLIVYQCIWYSCSDTERNPNNAYDPSQPIEIHDFLPDSGIILSQFVLKGSNFGTNVSDLNVYFNAKKATLLSATGDRIYGLVPRMPGENCTIKVEIGNDSAICTDKQFRYIVSASVTTLLGKLKDDGSADQKDGSFAEAMLRSPRFIGVDYQNNLLIVESGENNGNAAIGRIRLANEKEDKVITLTTAVDGGGLCMTADRKRMYIYGHNKKIYKLDVEKNYKIELYKNLETEWTKLGLGSTRMFGVGVDEHENIFFRTNLGHMVRIDHETKEAQMIYKEEATGQNSFFAYNPVDKKIYYILNWGELRRLDPNAEGYPSERVAGAAAAGHKDGYGEDARFNQPRGIAIDDDGIIYIAELNGNRIRKVTPDTYVSTFAGTGEAGWKDGKPEEAKFKRPWGLTADVNGFVYVADMDNHRIRKIAVE